MDGSTTAHSTAAAKSEEEQTGSDDQEDSGIDVSRKNWEISPFDSTSVYRNTFHLIPESVGDLVNLERPQVKFSLPGVSLEKLKSLKELELCRVPPVLSMLTSLQCLTKLSICHFLIRYVPPEIGHLKKLVELDLSFNKLKCLPDDIAELNALKTLRVANNELVDLPVGISSLRRLENLDLSNNRLTSLVQLRLASMQSLQCLNLQFNKLCHSCQIPSWILCKLEGNGQDVSNDEKGRSVIEVGVSSVAIYRAHGNHSSNGSHNISSCHYPDGSTSCRCSLIQRMNKGWKRRDYLQQRARQERLNCRRNWRVEDHVDDMIVKMGEEDESCMSTLLDKGQFEPRFCDEREKLMDCPAVDLLCSVDAANNVTGGDILLPSPDCGDDVKRESSNCSDIDGSCLTESTSSDKENNFDTETVSNYRLASLNESAVPDDNSSSSVVKLIVKSKRHCDRDLDNPKPSKSRRPVEDCSSLSCKYSMESFCSVDDHLPDGFYDAGRDRPFLSLQEYEQSLCLDSREVILLDRDKDEELDAIASSAHKLLSSFRRSYAKEIKDYEVDNLQRASILALFVSDCFGGSDRSSSVIKLRKATVGSKQQQPFICTCWTGNVHDKGEITKQTFGTSVNFNFNELCENSLRFIKATRNSNVIPIGTLRFGVCRHRAVLMKYLCDRADPPVPCELVRGYLDFMPHAWNTIHVRKGNSWMRMVVDACYPTDIREETDAEYYCRYIPLCRIHLPLAAQDSSLGCSFSSPPSDVTNKTKSQSVIHCKFGTIDAAAKVRNLDSCRASQEEIRNFEYSFLGEVRMLGALRKHRCIVEIYGHQLYSKWALPVDGSKENRLLQSIIFMEYIQGGSVKVYLEKLSARGEKHAPVDIAVCIAKDVACALVELHSKHIIHRDIKSENILIDLDCKRNDGTPLVKLADFDRSVPLRSFMHTCCNAHLGIHPPDICVGTPRWMAPEVVQAMHQRNPYGLEVDIWSYGCLIYELLTLQLPYSGQSEAEIYGHLQMKRRPRLTPELEAIALFDEVEAGSDDNTDAMRLLVDLFYECTSSDPTDRPTAELIYNKLVEFSRQPPAAALTECFSSNRSSNNNI